MVVGMSRDICVSLFDEIIALRPEWAGTRLDGDDSAWNPEDGAIRIVMTGSASDRAELQHHVYSKAQKKRVERRFKKADDPLKIVIVRDMWLTGFDAPCVHTMYVDKPMRSANLMQAIARVNRVFKDKPGGLVVDYIGIANELKNALKTYTDSKGKGRPANMSAEALSVLLEKLDVVRGMFATAAEPGGQGLDYSAYESNALALLMPAANHILALENGKQRFMDAVLAINKAFSLCGTLDEAKELRKEIAFISAVKAVITKYTTVDKKRTEQDKHSALKQISGQRDCC